MKRLAMACAFLTALVACSGSTGSKLLTFQAAAGGPLDATKGQPYSFKNAQGYAVTLTSASMQIGAIYLNRSVPLASERETSCVLPGTYVAEVRQPLVVDVLSAELQPLPGVGEGTADRAVTAEIWVGSGDINQSNDPTIVLAAKGTASKNGVDYPFEASFTIGSNRQESPSSSALPGSNPICQQRIISPIPVDVTPTNGGTLTLRVDPKGWFQSVDFSTLTASSSGAYRFVDALEGQASINLFYAYRSTDGVYSFDWKD